MPFSRLTHWDVNNEELHGSFFKDTLQNTSIMNAMFDLVHKYDPDVLLFLNEFNIVNANNYGHVSATVALKYRRTPSGRVILILLCVRVYV